MRSRLIFGLIAFAALAAAWVWGAHALWDTQVPADLKLPDLSAAQEFPQRELEKAESFEAFVRVTFLLSQVVLIAVLVVYAKRGAVFVRESAAGPIGTGFLLGMLGLALVWIAQVPFGLVDLWWARLHDVLNIGYVEWLVEEWLGLAGTFLFLCVALLIGMGLARLLRRSWWLPAALAFTVTCVRKETMSPHAKSPPSSDSTMSANLPTVRSL